MLALFSENRGSQVASEHFRKCLLVFSFWMEMYFIMLTNSFKLPTFIFFKNESIEHYIDSELRFLNQKSRLVD